VTSDFHCEWAIVASYANNGIDGVAHIALVIEWVDPRVVSVLAVAIKEVQQFVSFQ